MKSFQPPLFVLYGEKVFGHSWNTGVHENNCFAHGYKEDSLPVKQALHDKKVPPGGEVFQSPLELVLYGEKMIKVTNGTYRGACE